MKECAATGLSAQGEQNLGSHLRLLETALRRTRQREVLGRSSYIGREGASVESPEGGTSTAHFLPMLMKCGTRQAFSKGIGHIMRDMALQKTQHAETDAFAQEMEPHVNVSLMIAGHRVLIHQGTRRVVLTKLRGFGLRKTKPLYKRAKADIVLCGMAGCHKLSFRRRDCDTALAAAFPANGSAIECH